MKKEKSQKYRGKVKLLIKWENQKLKHIKRMDNKCHTGNFLSRK